MPKEIVRSRLDGVQNELGYNCRAFLMSGCATTRNGAAPHDHVQFSERGLRATFGEPGDTDSCSRRLEDTAGRRAMLLHRTAQLLDPLEYTFRCQLIQQRGDGPLDGGFGLRRR